MLKKLLALPRKWGIADYSLSDRRVELLLQHRKHSAYCPQCNMKSRCRYGFTHRRLQHLPCGGKTLILCFRLQRFCCTNSRCRQRTFQESISTLAPRWQRSSRQLVELTTRLAYSFGVRVSGDTLIHRIMQLPLSEPEQLTHIGVDDWAWKKGHHYGTIIVAQSTHRPVALLSGRSATSLVEWLKTRPEIKIITRDRAGAYADGAKTGAPQAIQIADRWHLIRNASDHFERFLKRHWVAVKETYHAIKTQALAALQSAPIITVSPQQETATQQQRRLLFEHVSVLKNKGMAQTEIALTAGISDKTVRRWLQTGGSPLCGKRPRPRQVIGFNEQTWLREQGNSGCHNAALLFRKLKTRGYVGGSATVRSLVSQWRYTSAEVLQYPPMPRLKQDTYLKNVAQKIFSVSQI